MREIPTDGQGRYEARVLVVEDDALLRSQLRHMVAKRVTEVQEAADGAAGLALWRGWLPDLVITDILMPERDGLEAIGELRRSAPDVKIIAISGGSKIGPGLYLDAAGALGAINFHKISKKFA